VPSLVRRLLLLSLGVLLGSVGVLLAGDTALAHGTCTATSSVSASGTSANYESTSECTQQVIEINALATLWSFDPNAGGPADIILSARYADWDFGIGLFDTNAAAADGHGMDSGRCYLTIGGHAAWDEHWRWTPYGHFEGHRWTTVSSSPWFVCRL
jgi:hypothetical protein